MSKQKPTNVCENVKRLRLIRAAEAPTCCGVEMVIKFINLGEIKGEELAELERHEKKFADYVAENAALPPVFVCEYSRITASGTARFDLREAGT